MTETQDARDYEKQWPGLPIKYLILSCDDFIVFIDHENDLDWKKSDDFSAVKLSDEDTASYNRVMNEISFSENIPCDNLEEKLVLNFKRQLGEALVRNFQHDFINAQRMIDIAAHYITDRNAEKSRFLLLVACSTVTGIVVGAGVIFWLCRASMQQIFSVTVFYILLAIAAGALGAFLSVILRIGKVELNCHASKALHNMEGATKIFAGMISAFLVALCIKCEIILPVFSNIEATHYAMILGGLIGGAAERLAPSIIQTLGNNKNHEEKGADNN